MTTLRGPVLSLALLPLLVGCSGGTFVYIPGPNQQLVSGFASTASGNALPLRQLDAGARVQAIASDTLGDLYIACDDGIRIYGPGANGNAAPLRIIQPINVDFAAQVSGLALDVATNVYAPLRESDQVVAFQGNASGPTPPFRTLGGKDTGIYHPRSVAIDRRLGTIYVANFGGFQQVVHAFAPGVSGNVAPVRTIIRQGVPLSLAVDADGNLYIAENGDTAAPSSVSVFAPDADGAAPPIRVLTGPRTQIIFPGGVAVEPDGTLYVSEGVSNSINVYAPGASGDTAPIRTISLAGAGIPRGSPGSTLALTAEP